MQLREIRIDGFGVLSDARIHGLTSGLNVLFGRNEFGKTTLLEFVRRVLFGFPTKASSMNAYPALRGGKYGGQIVCRLRDPSSSELTVSRTTGKGGGAVTIRSASGGDMTEEAFAALLGHASDGLYRNVFAVSLQELQEARQLQGDDLRNRIYGAGLGMGEVSISDLKKSFTDRAEKLYKPRGSTQEMNVLAGKLVDRERQIRDMARQLGQYDAKKREYDHCTADEGELRLRQRALQADQRSLERQASLYGTFVRLCAAQRELTGLGDVPDVSDATLGELRQLQQSIASLENRLQETLDIQIESQSESERLAFDPSLLKHESDIKSLSRGLAQYRDAHRDLPVRAREQELAREQVGRHLITLGEGWDEERVRLFALTAEESDGLQSAEDSLSGSKLAKEKAQDRLEDHRNQTHSSWTRPTLPAVYRVVGLTILGLGAAGCVYSIVNGHTIPSVILGIAGALGTIVALSLGSSTGPLRDTTVERLEAECEEREQQHREAQNDWGANLATLGLSPTLSPKAASEQLQSVDRLQESLRSIDEREARIQGMRTIVQTATNGLARVAASLSEPLSTTDIAAGIEAVEDRLDKAQKTKARRDDLLRDQELLKKKTASLATDGETERERLASLLSRFGVTSAEDFVTLHERSARRRTLRTEISNSTGAIQTAVGVGVPYEVFITTLEATSPEEIQSRLERVVEELTEVSAKLEAAIRLATTLEKDLDALVTSKDLLDLEAEAATLRQQLRDSCRGWLQTQLAIWAIDQAISKYETTRQPAVIREAQTVFALMTGAQYTALVSPLGSEDLRVRDSAGSEKSVVNELSRGTREQLYLSMRMGLIAQYEQNAEPLPIIMDDILVNFDDERGPLAVKALAEFAKDRQVIVMTCHKNTLELYRQAGATELHTSGKGTFGGGQEQ